MYMQLKSISVPGIVRDELQNSVEISIAYSGSYESFSYTYTIKDENGQSVLSGGGGETLGTSISIPIDVTGSFPKYAFKKWYSINIKIVGDLSGNYLYLAYRLLYRDPTPTNSKVTIETTLGTIRDELNKSVKYYYPSSSNNGIANRFKIQVKDTVTNTIVYETLRESASYNLTPSNPVKPTMTFPTSDLNYLNKSTLIITPCFYDSVTKTELWGSSSTVGSQTSIYRNPTPTKAPGITKGWGTIRDEKDRDFTVRYTSSSTNGIMNCYRFIVKDMTTNTVTYDNIISISSTLNTERTSTFTCVITTYPFKHTMSFQVIPGFKKSNNTYLWGSNNWLNDNALYRDPTPTNSNVTIETTLGTIKDEQDRTVSYFYPSSSDNGIANRFHIRVKDISSNTYVIDYWRESASYNLTPTAPIKPTMTFKTTELIYKSKSQLEIIPCFYDSSTGTLLTGSSTTVGIQTNIYRDPTPINAPGITKGWGTIRDEQNRNFTIKYTSSAANGIMNCYRFIVKDYVTGETTYDNIIPISSTLNVERTSTFTCVITTYPLKHRMSFQVIPGFKKPDDTYFWGSNTWLNDNALYRDPTPISYSAFEVIDVLNDAPNKHIVSIQNFDGRANYTTMVYYKNSQDTGYANSCKLELIIDNTVIYTEYGNTTSSVVDNQVAFIFNPILISQISSQYWNKSIRLRLQPVYKSGSTVLSNSSTIWNSTIDGVVFDAGFIENSLKILAPVSSNPVWFKPINTVEPKSLRIVVRLPIDDNYQYLTPEEQETYHYDDISIIVKSSNFSSKVSSNSSSSADVLNIFGDLSNVHMNHSIVINPTKLFSNVTDYTQPFVIVIGVDGPYGSSAITVFTMTFEDFPISYSNAALTGQEIKAETMLEYLKARRVLSTWTKKTPYTVPSISQIRNSQISYDYFYGIRDEIQDLYNLTKDIDSTNKYVVPMTVDSLPAPSYSLLDDTKEDGGRDYIYNNTISKATALDDVYTKPSDYDENYNSYFVKDNHYVWRSTDGLFDSDMVKSSPNGEYNVLYTYYCLVYGLVADIIEVEPVEDYVSGSLSGTLSVGASSLTSYSLGYLPNLTRIILGPDIDTIGPNTFTGTQNIQELHLSYPDGVVSVANTSYLTPLGNVTIKVPENLLEAYQADTVWNQARFTFVAL